MSPYSVIQGNATFQRHSLVTKLLETIKIVDGKILHVNYHQERLERSMMTLNYHHNYKLSSLLHPPKKGTYRCRVVYDDMNIEVEYIPYTLKKIRSLKIVEDNSIEYSLKYENRDALNALFKLKDDCDDIAIIKNGYLTDTTIANIALFNGEQWHTPKQPLLCGTTRQRLLENGTIVERDISLSSIPSYKKCAVFNAMTDFVELENGIIL